MNTVNQDFKQLIESSVGRLVSKVNEEGLAQQYRIASLSDKTGTMKDGTTGAYVMLVNSADESVIVSIHPNAARRLLTKGEGAGYTLVNEQTTEEAPAEVNGETEVTAAPTKTDEPAQPSKKDRASAIFNGAKDKARKDVIALFMSEVGLSNAGAATYYQNFKSGKWA